jgi:hypothetical protein
MEANYIHVLSWRTSTGEIVYGDGHLHGPHYVLDIATGEARTVTRDFGFPAKSDDYAHLAI